MPLLLKKILPVLSLSALLIFSACQSAQEGTRLAGTNVFQAEVDPYSKYSEFLSSNPKSREFYDSAYDSTRFERPILKEVSGGILPNVLALAPSPDPGAGTTVQATATTPVNDTVPAHVTDPAPPPRLPSEIASYFQRLEEKGTETQTVILIARNYGPATRNAKLTTSLPYDTPYGLLEPDSKTIEALTSQKILAHNSAPFKQEKIISFYAPFIKKTFPQARFIPILLEDGLDKWDGAAIGRFLAPNLHEKRAVVFAVSNFSNHPQFDLARFQTRYSRSLIGAGDFYNLESLNTECPPALFALNEFLLNTNSRTAIAHSKGMQEGRGWLMEYFTPGPARPTPEITLLAVGDIMLDRYVRTLMERKGEDYPFEKIAEQGFFGSAHIRLANLEGPITSTPRTRSGHTIFKFDPWMIDLLKRNGINLVTLANNHTLDQGKEGFDFTEKALSEGGLAYFGHPRNETTDRVYFQEINGLKIGFIGFHDATITMDADQAVKEIEDLRPKVDVLVVVIHWGIEYQTKSSARQQDLGHKFIDAGADAIIGHHPHVAQEIEWYKDKPVIYSLGNFIFDQYFSANTQKALTVGLIFSPQKVELYEFPINIPKSQPGLRIGD